MISHGILVHPSWPLIHWSWLIHLWAPVFLYHQCLFHSWRDPPGSQENLTALHCGVLVPLLSCLHWLCGVFVCKENLWGFQVLSNESPKHPPLLFKWFAVIFYSTRRSECILSAPLPLPGTCLPHLVFMFLDPYHHWGEAGGDARLCWVNVIHRSHMLTSQHPTI